MKSRRAQREKFHNDVYNVLVNNLVITLHVLHTEYGFGEKRLNDFLACVMEGVDRFDEMAADGIVTEKMARYQQYHEKIRHILKTATREYLPSEMYHAFFEENLPTTAQTDSKYKNLHREYDKKNAVSMAEAAQIQQAAQAFQAYMRDHSDNKKEPAPSANGTSSGHKNVK